MESLFAKIAPTIQIISAGRSQFASSTLYRRARPREIDHKLPVSRDCDNIACDIRRATRPLPSPEG